MSYVGLKSDKLGTVTFGRQFDAISDVVGPMTANGTWAGYLFSHPVDNDNTDGTFHASNSIKYVSPSFAGLTAEGIYGFSNVAGGFAQNRLFGGGLSYSYDTLSVGAVYEELSNPGVNATGAVASNDYVTFTATNQKVWGIGATYGIGNATLGAAYTHTSLASPSSSVYVGDLGLAAGTLKFDNFEVNAKYNFTPSFFVGGMYTYTRAHINDGGASSSLHWNQVGLMADYLLSKRTSIYAQAVYQNVSNGKSGTPLDVAYIPGAADLSSTRNQTVVRIGMSHSF
ncbi:porin [Paraburkholderia tropica]|uniref:porin n=1 Tax=Paraburkholderia tropica TaxID=92647 RepID=UPI002ABD9B99|nr:porin [Paraburkholderia tropica]